MSRVTPSSGRTPSSTGHWGPFDAIASAVSTVVQAVAPVVQATASVAASVADAATGISSMVSDVKTIFSGNASLLDKVLAGGDLLLNAAMDVSMVVGVGEGLKAAYVGMKAAGHLVEDAAVHAAENASEHAIEHELGDQAEHAASDAVEGAADSAGGACSFVASALVATPAGAHPIAALHTGQAVVAYNPATATSAPQVIQAVSLHHDTNLVDVTLRVTGTASATKPASAAGTASHATKTRTTSTHDETVHTTSNHPWLTADAGWEPAGFLRIGEPVVTADGSTAVVVAIHAVPGTAAMWDLTVSNVHTFAVGAGEYVVHNCGDEVQAATDRMNNAVRDHLTPSDLEGTWRDAHGDPVPRSGGGRPYQHLDEVWSARNSLVRSAEVFKSALNDSRTAAEDIPRLQRLLSYASNTADRVESIISADRWIPGTYIRPFR